MQVDIGANMKNTFVCTTLVVLLFGVATATAQETLLEYMLDACEDELVEFCDRVTPGEGRLLYCMAAHEDRISSECAVALYDAAGILQELANAVAFLAAACATDINAYCADTPMGEGRILGCLEAKGDDVSDACKAAVSEVVEE